MYLGKSVGNVPSVIGLKRRQRIDADREVVEIFRWYGLRKPRGARRIDAERAYAGNKTEVGEFSEAGLGLVSSSSGAKEAQAELVHCCRAEHLVVAHDKLLGVRGCFAGKPGYAGIQGVYHIRAIPIVVERPVARLLVIEVDALANFVVASGIPLAGIGKDSGNGVYIPQWNIGQ